MGEVVQNSSDCYLRQRHGHVVGTVRCGDLVEVLSGPHEYEGEARRYVVRHEGAIGILCLTEAELGHPHGPLVPWPTTDAPTVTVQTDGTGPVRAPELKITEGVRDGAIRDLQYVRGQLDIAESKLNLVTSEFKAAELDLQKMRESRDATQAKLAEARDDSRLLRERIRSYEAQVDALREKGHDFEKVVEARDHWQCVAAGLLSELETERKTTAFISKEAAAHKAEAERLKGLPMPDFIEWKVQQEQRMTTESKSPALTITGDLHVDGRVSQSTHPIVKTLTADAEDAAWRLAGSQFVKLTRDPLSALLSRHLGPEDDALRGKVADFLKTELGAAMLASLLSLGLSSLPEGNGVAPRLARELRVSAMAGASDAVADVFMGPLRQVVATYLQDLPAAPSAPPTLPEGTHAHAPITAAVVGEEVGR